MRNLVGSYRLQTGICFGIIAALALAQLVVILLHHWPASTILWFLYFEFSRRLDFVYRVLEASLDIGPVGFLVAAAATLGIVAVRARIRLLEALVLHGALACALLVLFDNLGLGRDAPLSATSPALAQLGLVMLFAILALPLAGGCLRIHAAYLQLARRELA